MMKLFLIACVLGVAQCAHLHADLHAVAAHPVALHTGASSQYRSQDNIGNYAFGYNEDHTTGGTFRRESGDAHGNKVGSYGLRDADGRLRIVNYVADALGFRANIQTNEPGVEPKDPAATLINKAAVVEAHPAAHAPLIHAAPAFHAPIVAAPHHLAHGHHAELAHGHHGLAHGHHGALLAPSHGHLIAAPAVHHPAVLAAPHHAPIAYASAVHHAAPLLHHFY